MWDRSLYCHCNTPIHDMFTCLTDHFQQGMGSIPEIWVHVEMMASCQYGSKSALNWDLVTGGRWSTVSSLSCSRNQFEMRQLCQTVAAQKKKFQTKEYFSNLLLCNVGLNCSIIFLFVDRSGNWCGLLIHRTAAHWLCCLLDQFLWTVAMVGWQSH